MWERTVILTDMASPPTEDKVLNHVIQNLVINVQYKMKLKC
jgi:hypothetical protein